LALSYSLYWVLLSVLVLHGIATVWAAVLNALNRFAVAAAVPMTTSFFTIAAVLTLTAEYGVHALAVGSVTGAVVETALIGRCLVREGVPLLPRWTGMTRSVRQVVGQYVPVAAGAVLMGGTGVVSQAMAGMLEPGSVSALAYGGKVANLLLGIGATAVGTAFLPYLARMVAVADWEALRQTISRSTGWLLAATIPTTALLMYWSEPIVALLFQRGAFTESDTRLVSSVQIMFLVQIPAYVVGMVFVRLVSALKANALLMWCNMFNLSLCIVLTYLFVGWLGVSGIALATSLIYFVNTGMLGVLAWRILRRQEGAAKARVVPAFDAV
jgi:putative peptidoglycan lipid II flippase